MAALDRAIALEQMNRISGAVGEDLHFDVARPREIFLNEEPAVAERGQRLAPRRRQRLRQAGRALDHPHATSAAAGRRLDQHGIAQPVRFRGEARIILILAVIAGHDRNARRRHQSLGARLVA